MSLRTRIALVAALAVALGVVLVSLAAYASARGALFDQVDADLRNRAERGLHDLGRGPGPFGREPFGGPSTGRFGGPGVFRQLIGPNATPLPLPDGSTAIPVDDAARAAVRDGLRGYSDITIERTRLRVLAVPVGSGYALQIARPVDEIHDTLRALGGRLVLVSALGIALASGLGLLVANRGVRPVTRLTEDLEHVARTRDLSHRVAVEGHDEPARLAQTFNAMLESLGQARAAQEQLVADASHELRTPLAALRTNAELLASGVEIPADERRRIARDVAGQIDGFGRLVADLVELTRGERPPTHPEPVALDDLVEELVDQARSRHPGVAFTTATEPCTVTGDRTALERAVGNLITNAVVHGAPPVEVSVRGDGVVEVRDHGAGVPDADRARVFARFWRAADARGREGSGLGLAIVHQIARTHGGTVEVGDTDGGGARFTLRLPTS